jgi:hypothetical protein
MHAVLLWGSVLVGETLANQLDLLSEAVRCVRRDWDGIQAVELLQTIQAEVLIALFLLRIGRLLEAKVHTSSAVGMILAAGLHRMGSNAVSAFLKVNGTGGQGLAAPRDGVEACERRNGCWSVYFLQATVELVADTAVLTQGPYSFKDWQIDTPWPDDVPSVSFPVVQHCVLIVL